LPEAKITEKEKAEKAAALQPEKTFYKPPTKLGLAEK